MSRVCICCGEKGHQIMACPRFHEEMKQPSVGTCGKCGGRGMFMPYVAVAAGVKQAKAFRDVQARLLCACCSYPECPHPEMFHGQPVAAV